MLKFVKENSADISLHVILSGWVTRLGRGTSGPGGQKAEGTLGTIKFNFVLKHAYHIPGHSYKCLV